MGVGIFPIQGNSFKLLIAYYCLLLSDLPPIFAYEPLLACSMGGRWWVWEHYLGMEEVGGWRGL